MMSDEHKKAMSDQDLESWLNENPDIKQDFEEQTGLQPIERLLEEVGNVTSLPTPVPSTPTAETCLSLGSMPQFAEILFRPNGEVWLNTDLFQLAIQPGISRILLGQPT